MLILGFLILKIHSDTKIKYTIKKQREECSIAFLLNLAGINIKWLFKGPTYEYDRNTIQTRAPLSTENTNAFSW